MTRIILKLLHRFSFLVSYYLIHRANPISYLRSQGAVIGKNCDTICGVGGFGTEPYLIHIGNNVTLAGGVNLITHDGGTRVFRHNESRWTLTTGKYGRIVIGDNVFIGTNAIVLPGVEIGSNIVIGAGSVVTKNIPSGSVAAGNPAHYIRTIGEYQETSLNKTICLKDISPEKKKDELIKIFWS